MAANDITISRDDKTRYKFFIGALANNFHWYFHKFEVPEELLKHSKNLEVKKGGFSIKRFFLRRKAKKFFEESDEYFKKDIEKMYGFLEEKKEFIEKIYSYIPFFTKENWPHKTLTIIVLPANSAMSNSDGEICVGIRPPKLMEKLNESLLVHEMIHLNIENCSDIFLKSGDDLQIDAEELYVILLTKKICTNMGIENSKGFDNLPLQFKKYSDERRKMAELNMDEWKTTEEAIHSISNILKEYKEKAPA